MSISASVLDAIEKAPRGVLDLAFLESLALCDADTLKTTLSRLNKAGRIIRLKRGLYSAKPLKDAFFVGQEMFGGYLGFTSALYLHRIISEMPFSVSIVTTETSAVKMIDAYEFRAVALHEKAVGFERLENHIVSTRAKTLFDCVYLPRYSVEEKKLAEAFREARLSGDEWKEYDSYVRRFAKKIERFDAIKRAVRG